jgi:hypothetical protein
VHAYLLPGETGWWTLVDTGLGLPDAISSWRVESVGESLSAFGR